MTPASGEGDQMRKVLLVAAALGLTGSTVAITGAQADKPSARVAVPVQSLARGLPSGDHEVHRHSWCDMQARIGHQGQ